MAEWFFFGTLIMAAMVVFLLLVNRKNRHKKIQKGEESHIPLVSEFIDNLESED
jgi:hypothetical protein